MERVTKRDAWSGHLEAVRTPSALFSGPAYEGVLRLLTLGGALPYRSAAAALTFREKALVQHLLGRREIQLEPVGDGDDAGDCDGAEPFDVLVAHSSLGALTLHFTAAADDDPPEAGDVLAGLRLPDWLIEMVQEEAHAEELLEAEERAGIDALLAGWDADGALGERLDEVIDWVERVETVMVRIGRQVFSRSDSGSSTLIRDGVLTALRDRPLGQWTAGERLFVGGAQILFRSGGPIRFEEFNGRQLTATALRRTLLQRCGTYRGTGAELPAGLSTLPLDRLAELAGELAHDADGGPAVRYRRVNGISYAKHEYLMEWDPAERQVGPVPPVLAALAARHLGADAPLPADTAPELVRHLTGRAAENAILDGDATPLEEVLQAIVHGAALATGGDYAMSSGIRDLSKLYGGDVEPVLDLKKPDFFCCVLPTAELAGRMPGEELSPILWQVAQRMMYNRWHFMPGNYTRGEIPRKRHYFFAPILPDIGEWGGLRHGGHITSQVRYTLRAPGAAMWMPPFAPFGHPYRGTYDIRVVRMEGPPFTLEDLRTASRYSHLVDVFWRRLAEAVRDAGGLGAPRIGVFTADWYRDELWREPLARLAVSGAQHTQEVTVL